VHGRAAQPGGGTQTLTRWCAPTTLGNQMKIINYNLHNGGKANQWDQINKEVPDLILVQESFDPALHFADNSVIHKRVVWSPLPAKWGSAVVAPKFDLEPIRVSGYEHWVAGARIPSFRVGDIEKEIFAFSVHAPSPGPYEKEVSAIIDAVTSIAKGADVIIGGDLNVTTAVRHPNEKLKNSKIELQLITRLRQELGLVNAWQAINPNQDLPQTLRWSRDPEIPYHCDAIFIPSSWLPHLESCHVLNSAKWSSLSDHYPIVAKIYAQP